MLKRPLSWRWFALGGLLLVSCGADSTGMPTPSSTSSGKTGSGGASAGAGGSQDSTGGRSNDASPGNGGQSGGSGAGGSAAGTGGSGPNDASALDTAAPIDAGADVLAESGVVDPGIAGDGDFVIGPNYTNAPELTANPTAPKGTVVNFSMDSRTSAIYKGISGAFMRGVWVYIPKQYVDGTAAPLIIAQDGGQFGTNGMGYIQRLPTVLDNMIYAKKLPPMIALMINPGPGDGRGSERGLEYDTVSEVYSNFIETEALPAVQHNTTIQKAYPNLKFTTDPEGRATLGCSSGSAAALTMGWFHPDRYRRLTTYSGTFVNQDPQNPVYPHGAWSYGESLIASTDAKPLRIFLQVGENDNNLDSTFNDMMHNWIKANQMVAAALKAKNYHYRFLFAKGAGHCDDRVQAQTLPETLLWIWRGYPIP